MNAVENCNPQCPHCLYMFCWRNGLHRGHLPVQWFWIVCRCGWRGYAHFIKEQTGA